MTSVAAGGFLLLNYTWSDGGRPHDGVLIVRVADEPGPVDMVWVDSFHTDGKFMQFEGRPTTDCGLDATTNWSAGDGPDWGWRIHLSSSDEELLVRMYIATPEGEEAPAVESRYRRKASA